jgi:hypothetical protein
MAFNPQQRAFSTPVTQTEIALLTMGASHVGGLRKMTNLSVRYYPPNVVRIPYSRTLVQVLHVDI